MGQYNRIADAILTLDSFPDRFALFESEPEHSRGMRRMVGDNYLVCYMVDPGVVTVTDVLYGASNVHVRLQERHPKICPSGYNLGTTDSERYGQNEKRIKR